MKPKTIEIRFAVANDVDFKKAWQLVSMVSGFLEGIEEITEVCSSEVNLIQW